MKTIGIIGAGTMGSGIALIVAQAGCSVVVNDIGEESLKRGLDIIEKRLSRNVEKGRISDEEKCDTLARIKTTTNLKDLGYCDLVIEAAIEDINIKKNIFRTLDEVCQKETILATNTSSLSITEIAGITSRPDRVVGMHFFNPVPVMKLVEVIKGIATSDIVKERIVDFAVKLGKTPVLVEEAPGFVVNRLLIPMINEAINVFAEGVASVEDIDNAMKLGANHPIGPLALADLIGLDVCLAIMEVLYTEFADSKYRPHPLLRKIVRGGLLGRKSGRGFHTY